MIRPLVVLPLGLLLAACGSGSGAGVTTLPTTGPSGQSVVLSADPATCVPTASASPAPGTASPVALGPTCTLRVHYANVTSAPLAIDTSLTRVTDDVGSTYRLDAVDGSVTSAVVAPSGEVTVDWTVVLASGSSLQTVTWIGPAGDTSSVGLTSAPSASATPAATPKATPAPTSKPTPTATAKPRPTPTPTKTRTTRPRPASSAPPASGSIG